MSYHVCLSFAIYEKLSCSQFFFSYITFLQYKAANNRSFSGILYWRKLHTLDCLMLLLFVRNIGSLTVNTLLKGISTWLHDDGVIFILLLADGLINLL